MRHTSYRWIWGVVSLGIYLVFVGLLVWYFNVENRQKLKRFVVKDEHKIQVTLASEPPRLQNKPSSKRIEKRIVETEPKSSTKRMTNKSQPKKKKPLRKKTHAKGRKKIVKKDAGVRQKSKKRQSRNEHNRTKSPNVKSLFAKVKTPDKPVIEVHDKPIRRTPTKKLFSMIDAPEHADSHSRQKRKRKDSGVENAYLAKVQRMLEGWPAQSDFAGEKVKVYLKIKPSGDFTFEFRQKANNPAFNEALRDYLEQLQRFGFGPHKGKRTYLFEAEFVAKE